MTKQATFDEVLDVIETWPSDQQAELLEVVRRRHAERGRQRVVQDVQDARLEFAKGSLKSSTVDELMREIES
jgi:hypothetical protein